MSTPEADATFRTTRWSVVLEAGGEDAAARVALSELCERYWYPLYALARRRGLDRSGAEDAVQGFFADFLERGDVDRADPSRGRFRAYLATAFRNHLANARARERALKRGGGRALVSLDVLEAEARYEASSGQALRPEALFDRAWALALLDQALEALRADYVRRGRARRFDLLRPCLTADDEAIDRAAVAEELALREGALKVAIHRLRQRYRDAVRQAVRDTVGDEDAVEDELAVLFRALGG